MSNYVEWFVNRVKQHEGFLKMLARQTQKQIMVIESPAETGKTWLVQRELHEGRTRNLPVAHVDFRDRQPWDYLLLVRQFRDQLDAQHFNTLTQVINQSTTLNIRVLAGESGTGAVNINLASESSTISDSTISVGDVAGGSVIKDNFFYVQADSDTARRAIELRISDAFIAALQELAKIQPVVILLDSYEAITVEADRWLRFSFLNKVRDKLLPNIIIIIAGRKTPEIDQTWQPVVFRPGMEPFEEAFVTEYIVERRKLSGLDLATIYRTSGGNPGLLAKMADIATVDKSDNEDWGL